MYFVWVPYAHEGNKRSLKPLVLELHMIMLTLGCEPKISVKAASALNSRIFLLS